MKQRTMSQRYWEWCGQRRPMGLIGLTCKEWCDWWIATGVFDQRGSAFGQYRMCRVDIRLPFSLDNIELKQTIRKKK